MRLKDSGDELTLGTCLSALWQLAHGQHGTQAQWFEALFGSYFAVGGDDPDYKYHPDASTVNRIMRSKNELPRPMYVHYARNGHLLAEDVEVYLDKTIVSARQYQDHMTTLRDLADHGNNLIPEDKAYILGYAAAAEADHLTELLSRMLEILIREPIAAAA